MKTNSSINRKMRYGGVSLGLTALIIVAVIIVNVIFGLLTQSFMWYTDLTPPLKFTLSDACIELLRNGDDDDADSESPIDMIEKFREENKKYNSENGLKKGDAGWKDEELTLNIIFCDEPDVWKSNLMQRYVSHTAHQLADEFRGYITVEYIDTVRNPSAVSKYKENSLSVISESTVIVECGTEFRIRNVRGFYTYESDTATTPWAYSGEKAFTADILAVTRTESPVACIEVGHGVSFNDQEVVQTLVDAGYDLSELRLNTDEIPEDCRLIVIMNPKMDFTTGDDGISDVDEIGKLEAALERGVSLMVFMSPDNPVLENFEEFLEEWGIVFDRYVDKDDPTGTAHSYMIENSQNGIGDKGYTFIADYAKANKHTSILRDLTSRPSAPAIVFKNAMSISFADTFEPAVKRIDEDDASTEYKYAYKTVDGITTSIYDLFVTGDGSVAYANGSEQARGTDAEPLKLMTVSSRTVITSESYQTSVSDHTYIFACGSADFTNSKLLQNNAYGNNDALLSIFRTVGKELAPVGLNPKAFSDTTIDVITSSEATQYTVVLTVVPAIAALVIGVVVLVRRKYR